MKENIIFGLVILLAIFAISSCSILGVGISMTSRVAFFVANLNGSRENIIDNIDVNSPGYKKANTDSYWSDELGIWNPASKDFSITVIKETSSSLSGTFKSKDFPNGTTILFEMKDDGDFLSGENWKIWSCTVDGIAQF